ncbi:hypothetical protein T08_7678 [Trichinella sp. T8]|nr:hypothetical protein T08_7678 [Trichinella sp. T8]
MLKPARSASLSCGRLLCPFGKEVVCFLTQRYIRYPHAWNEGDFEIAMGIPEFEQLKILLINDRKSATWSLHEKPVRADRQCHWSQQGHQLKAATLFSDKNASERRGSRSVGESKCTSASDMEMKMVTRERKKRMDVPF